MPWRGLLINLHARLDRKQSALHARLQRCKLSAPVPALRQVRDLYWTVRNFRQRVLDFLRYRRVTANLDERFQVPPQSDQALCGRSK